MFVNAANSNHEPHSRKATIKRADGGELQSLCNVNDNALGITAISALGNKLKMDTNNNKNNSN